jgi:hypothetical protein
MIDVQQQKMDALKRYALALIGASDFADSLSIANVKLNENGSVTIRFVADDFNEQDDEQLD